MLLSLTMKLPLTWQITKCESLFTTSFLTCISYDDPRLANNALYSATSLEGLKSNLIAQLNLCPSRLTSNTPAPEPVSLEEPSTNRFQPGGVICFRCHFDVLILSKLCHKICEWLTVCGNLGDCTQCRTRLSLWPISLVFLRHQVSENFTWVENWLLLVRCVPRNRALNYLEMAAMERTRFSISV